MATDYDLMAPRYRRAKLQPWRTAVESYTLFDLLGNLTGQAVVDLACGEGFYTRRLRQNGAAPVLGVDLSREMIALARAEEEAQPLGIDYLQGDVKGLALASRFDLAVAAYLLNYARNRAELDEMCRSVAGSLKPGARFVTINTNPGLDVENAPSYSRYGFEVGAAGPLGEGTPITWTFHLEDGSLQVENYHLDVTAHEEALRDAGFREVTWHRPRLAPGVEGSSPEGYWEAFMGHPPVIFLECRL